ncbi:glycosyl hydrolase [Ilyonectria destructans]|nr:glycosyl hydrolase [Ilyonectria destructans]
MEVGVSVFQDQAQHFDLGIVVIKPKGGDKLKPHLRFRGHLETPYRGRTDVPVNPVEMPDEWVGKQLTLQIEAINSTHFEFQAGPAGSKAEYGEFFTAGLYALTIRYYDGIFYVVCTNLKGRSGMPSTEDFAPENFIITSTDLTDPKSFSGPIYVNFWVINQSPLFNDDRKVYIQGRWIYGYRKKPATTICSGDKCPEVLHIYKNDGVYWLPIAEGGTHGGHKITMARSKNIWGPYESRDRNPVLTT